MEWLQEILKAVGIELTQEALEQIKAKAGELVVPKTDFDAKETELAELNGKYDTDTKALNETLATVRLEHALDNGLRAAGVRNPALVRKLINLDGLKQAEDGSVEGLSSHIESLKKSDSYLFAEAEGFKGNEPPAGDPPPPSAPATLAEAVAAKLAK